MSIHVLYHDNCYDGFTAAWSAYKGLETADEPVTYLAVRHGYSPPELPPGSTVYILDFCYPRDVIERLAERHRTLYIIDHHQTAQADLLGLDLPNVQVTFDMQKSGALLTWEHFWPQVPAPYLVRAVSDRDLWRWEVPGSREVHTYLQSFPFCFAGWDQHAADLELDRDQILEAGRSLVRYRDQQVEQTCQQAGLRTIGGLAVPCCNATGMWSEVGNRLLELFPQAQFSVSWFLRRDGRVQVSLRSRADFDCSVVARTYGGGGHRQSSGFSIDAAAWFKSLEGPEGV